MIILVKEMNAKEIYEYPLVITDNSGRPFLARKESLSKEHVFMTLHNPEGNVAEIGVISAVSALNKTKKVFCYSYSEIDKLNIITAYMEETFNSKLFVGKKTSKGIEENLNFEVMHIGEIQKESLCGYKNMKNAKIKEIADALVCFHKENTKMYSLEKINLGRVEWIYNRLVYSGKVL
jgi:hypothetical protein